MLIKLLADRQTLERQWQKKVFIKLKPGAILLRLGTLTVLRQILRPKKIYRLRDCWTLE
jgi:hypothetical protein